MTSTPIPSFFTEFGFPGLEADLLPPLTLAYVGDAVYELYVRHWLVHKRRVPVHQLHRHATQFVKAQAQSQFLHGLEEWMTEEEKDIARRGRNAKSGSVPKNADVTDYRHATAMEALVGWLFLKQRYERLDDLMRSIFAIKEGQPICRNDSTPTQAE